MPSSEQILEAAARDGSIDIAEWPRVLESVLRKLHHIVHNHFPLPSLPLSRPDLVASTPPPPAEEDADQELPDADQELPDAADPPPNSQTSAKENEPPAATSTPRPAAPPFSATPIDALETPPSTLPPDLFTLYTTSTHTLHLAFSHSPPYTIQRLAELVLNPQKHYRFLPAYLRALDRIVSVSSPVSDFPLPQIQPPASRATFPTNGDSSQANGITTERDGLGSDESLGGALLTPIPWLRNPTRSASTPDGELRSERTQTIQGPHGAGSVETVSVTVNGVHSVSPTPASNPASPTLSDQSDASPPSSDPSLRDQGGVTQGELLRQEQEAGVVPVAQASPRHPLLAGRERAPSPESDPSELPHARGPELVGMQDMGPQPSALLGAGLDMAAAVGRARSRSPQPPPSPVLDSAVRFPAVGAEARPDVETELARLRERMDEQATDADGDVALADVDAGAVADEAAEEAMPDAGVRDGDAAM